MSDSILIIGESGSGKSRSIAKVDPTSTFLIQAIRKSLPFKGWRDHWNEVSKEKKGGNLLVSDDAEEIRKYLIAISERRPEIKTVIIDDAQYIMGNEFMRSAMEKGYEKFTRIGQSFWSIVMETSRLRQDLKVVFFQHSETTDAGLTKAKTIGKMLDDKISLEGMFTVVLRAMVRDSKHVFRTKNSGNDTVKAPEGMFSSEEIENDLCLVLDAVNAY